MENLKEKAIKIKGKDYVLVSDRILAFNEMYEKADIKTSYEYLPELSMFIVKAEITCDKGTFTGLSQAVVGDGYINKTSALENAETSAVGRALGMMGIGVLDSVASADEINKASNNEIKKPANYIGLLKTKLKEAKTLDEALEILANKTGVEIPRDNKTKLEELINNDTAKELLDFWQD